MASSAAHSIQGNASLHALHGKSHHKSAQDKATGGDRFDDALAQADSTPESKPAPKAESRKAQKAEKTDKPSQSDQTDAKDDTKTDVARSETGKDAAKTDEKDGDKKDGAANDNVSDITKTDAAADMLPPVPVQPTTIVAQVKTEAGTAEDAAPQAIDANAPAAAKEGAQPASEGVAQTPANEFKKALHAANDQSTAAKPADTEIAKAADAPTEIKPAADGNSLTIAAPTANNPRGVEKFVLPTTADAAPPQATPDVNQFAVEVAAKSQSGAKQFDIRLDPPELGRVEVRLSIDATGKAEAHLTADQPQTLDLLQKDASVLTRALRDAGLNVAQDGLNFSLKNQQGNADGGERQQGGTRHGFANSNSTETAQQDASAYQRRALGLLDIRV